MNYFKLSILLVLFLWIFGFLFIMFNSSIGSNNVNNNENDNNLAIIVKRLNQAELELRELEVKNERNVKLIGKLKSNLVPKNDFYDDLPIDFEELRRKTYADFKDLSFYLNSQIEFLLRNENLGKKSKEILGNLQIHVDNRVKVLLAEMYNLSISSDFGQKRLDLAQKLHQEVHTRFETLQNPIDCDSARTLVCDLAKPCGFGCQMHHVMYCLIEAYFQNRTMILESNNWRYDPNGYENYFKPLSHKCNFKEKQGVDPIRLSIIDSRSNKPAYLPLGVPKDLAPLIAKFHSNPFVWWAGEILTYLMRFNDEFGKEMHALTERIGLQRPCVGVHVRRTDKIGTEASLHQLDEYMKHVKDYFDIYSLINPNKKLVNKIVYLASDELSVMEEASSSYKEYKFVYDKEIAQSAVLASRYSPTSLKGVISDIYHLSQCDYLVCTFSSQVCRMAYELMQSKYPDAAWRFKSLDDIYYYGGQNDHIMQVVFDHKAENENEIDLSKGDLVSIAGDHWNGYSKGKNIRTNRVGLFPSYKVKDTIIAA